MLFDEFCKYVSNALCSTKTLNLSFEGEPAARKPPRKIGSSSRKKKTINQTGKKKKRKQRSVREKFEVRALDFWCGCCRVVLLWLAGWLARVR